MVPVPVSVAVMLPLSVVPETVRPTVKVSFASRPRVLVVETVKVWVSLACR